MTIAKPLKEELSSYTPSPGRDELNFAEFPFGLLTDRPSSKQKALTELVFEDEITRNGEPIRRKVIISSPPEYGLPLASDNDVLLGLMQLTRLKQDNKFSEPTVHFTLSELLRILRWEDTGKNYRRLRESIERLKAVNIHYKNAWFDREGRVHGSKMVSVLAEVELYERIERKGLRGGSVTQGALPFSYIEWGPAIFKSFQAGFLRKIDLEKYLALKRPVAKRILRYVGKHFYHSSRLEYDLKGFACDHIGLSRDLDTGVLRQRLEEPLRELEEQESIGKLTKEERYRKLRPGVWNIVFVAPKSEKPKISDSSSQPTLAEATKESSAPVLADEQQRLVKELVKRGVTENTARGFVVDKDEAYLDRKLDEFDDRMERGKKIDDSGAYLVSAIRKDWAPLKGYRPQAERDAAKERVKAGRQSKEQEEQAERLKTHLEKLERRHIGDFLKNLSGEQREQLEQDAVATATPEEKERLKRHDGIRSMQVTMLVNAEVLRRRPFDKEAAAKNNPVV